MLNVAVVSTGVYCVAVVAERELGLGSGGGIAPGGLAAPGIMMRNDNDDDNIIVLDHIPADVAGQSVGFLSGDALYNEPAVQVPMGIQFGGVYDVEHGNLQRW
ncbi:hypothetical protein SPBR_03360 [Sporothrix brasiliensis 5110]|uniref:Uncharacterized protein n=1 Tax=Sporothrix brasiliensis 5110 TaxID=1398154 RepID=A0A0C2J257_9PEZI|nr:uncharacterized protein SPBR_03360 [Sporothrix brasiliensis 5110]KIH93105.1 hypothetical protein SPBR_03360 [Sporothrix brasiliensis 5110]